MLMLQVFSLMILNLRCQRFNTYRHSRGFSGPESADVWEEIGTKMPFFQVPSSGNDSAEMVKLQNPLFSML